MIEVFIDTSDIIFIVSLNFDTKNIFIVAEFSTWGTLTWDQLNLTFSNLNIFQNISLKSRDEVTS